MLLSKNQQPNKPKQLDNSVLIRKIYEEQSDIISHLYDLMNESNSVSRLILDSELFKNKKPIRNKSIKELIAASH
jgi:hypothetical protein